MSASCVPLGMNSLNMYATFKDVDKALAFYKEALHGRETLRMRDKDGNTVHAEMMLGHTTLMMGTESEEMQCLAPESIGGSPISFFLYVPELAQAHARALRAGMHEAMPPKEMFWGDEMSVVVDPFGYKWSLGHQTKQLNDAEMRKAAEAEGLVMEKAA